MVLHFTLFLINNLRFSKYVELKNYYKEKKIELNFPIK